MMVSLEVCTKEAQGLLTLRFLLVDAFPRDTKIYKITARAEE